MSTWRPIVVLAFGQTLVWASLYYIFPALLLRWEAEFGWARAEVTLAFTLAVLTSGVCAPLAGWIIDQGYGDRLMTGSALVGALAMMGLSQTQTLWQFYAVWLLAGAAMAGALYEPCFAVVTRARGPRAKAAITAITLIAGFAGTLSFPLANWVADVFGWRATVLLSALVIAGIGAPLNWIGVRGLGPADAGTAPKRAGRRAGILGVPAFWFLALGFGCAALVHGATLHHLLPYLDERSIPAALAITIAALIGPMQVAGRILMTLAGRFIPTHGLMLVTFVVLGTSVAVLHFGTASAANLYAFVFLFGGAWGTVSILRPVIVRTILGGDGFGAKSGMIALVFLTGAATAPFLGALAWGIGGYGLMMPIVIALAGTGAGLYLLAHWRSADTGSEY